MNSSQPLTDDASRRRWLRRTISHPAGMAWLLSRNLQGQPTWIPARHLLEISHELANGVTGASRSEDRLLLATPPRHGKSLLTSHWFPVWVLANWPHKRILLCSYESNLATRWSRMVRNTLMEHGERLGVEIAQDTKRAQSWGTTAGGGMLAAGVGGAITGWGADVLIVDDPVKNAEEASSDTYREKTDEWWKQTAATRGEPGAFFVGIQTRWHEDDWMGRRIQATKEGEERWRLINFPAIAEDDDALGRDPGEALWPDRYSVRALGHIRKEVGTYAWASLYQQRPMPLGGGTFKRAWFRYFSWTEEGHAEFDGNLFNLKHSSRFATVDLATSIRDEADYTVICVWAAGPDYLLLVDVIRDHFSGPEIIPAIRRALTKWDVGTVWIEKVGFQLALVQQARAAGLPVRELIPDRDKLTRALASTPYLENGQVLWPRAAPWLDAFEHELLHIPNSTYWDQCDAFAYGVYVWRKHGPGGLRDLPDMKTRDSLAERLRDEDGATDWVEEEATRNRQVRANRRWHKHRGLW